MESSDSAIMLRTYLAEILLKIAKSVWYIQSTKSKTSMAITENLLSSPVAPASI